MKACNQVSGCTGIFMVYENDDELRSCHLLNITQQEAIFVTETPSSAPTEDPWSKFYTDGVLPGMKTAVFIGSKSIVNIRGRSWNNLVRLDLYKVNNFNPKAETVIQSMQVYWWQSS